MSFDDDDMSSFNFLGNGCELHGDAKMLECTICGAEYCGICFPNPKMCESCASIAEDIEGEDEDFIKRHSTSKPQEEDDDDDLEDDKLSRLPPIVQPIAVLPEQPDAPEDNLDDVDAAIPSDLPPDDAEADASDPAILVVETAYVELPASDDDSAPEAGTDAKPVKKSASASKSAKKVTEPASKPAKKAETKAKTAKKPVTPAKPAPKPAKKPAKPAAKPAKAPSKPAKPAKKAAKPAPKPAKPAPKPQKTASKPQKTTKKPSKPAPKPAKPAKKAEKSPKNAKKSAPARRKA
jgi:hypothetical protein